MKRSQIIMVAGILVALSLGLALAYPLYITGMPTFAKANMGLEVVYTYISAPLSNSSLTGLWRNSSDEWQADNVIFSYMIVMNITNYSNTSVQMIKLHAIVGPTISADADSGALSAANPVVNDERELMFGSGLSDTYWLPYESRLVSLTGMNGVPESFYNVLNGSGPVGSYSVDSLGTHYLLNGSSGLFVYGRFEGQIAYSKSEGIHSTDLKQVQFQNVQGDYLYNNLLQDNQMLRLYFNGLDVQVVPRSLD